MFEASAEIGDKDRDLIFRRIDWSEKDASYNWAWHFGSFDLVCQPLLQC